MVMNVMMGPGAVWDITSSYPASAYPMMPADYIDPFQRPEFFEEPILVTRDNIDEIVKHNMYYAAFEFPQDVLRPTISIRTKDTMICPLTTLRKEGNRTFFEFYWLWGVELRQAIRLGNAIVWVKKQVQYKPAHTHRDFMDFMFKERQKYNADDEPVMNQLYKLLMNSLYGKHG